jgi:phosphatidate cytidylyltransferase
VSDDSGPDGPGPGRHDPRPSQRIRIVGAEPAGGDEAEDDAADRPPADPPAEANDPNKFGAIPKISADGPPPSGMDNTDEGTVPPATPVEAAPDIPEVQQESDPLPDPDDLELPHWTDPPTGQVPAVGDDEDLDVWAGLSTGPQWKGQGDEDAAAEDFSDLHDEDLAPETVAVSSDDGPGTVAFDDLSATDRPDTSEPAGGPPQRPADPAPVVGDPYPPRYDEPVTAGPDGGGRDMNTAVAVGVGLVVARFVSFFIGSAGTVVLATAIITLAAAEFFTATRKAGYHPVPIIGLVATPCMVLAAYWKGEVAIPLVMFLVIATTMLWWLMDLSPDRAVPNIGITVFGVFYVGGLGAFAALLLRLPNGIGLLFGAILVTVAYDVGGLFIGRRFGQTSLGDASPNKTVEGLVGGGIVAVVVSVVVLGVIGVFPWEIGDAFALGIGAAIAAPLGDLCESMLKRDLGIKDMGDILPGHGGVLDRFDALLFVLPTTFYVVRALEVYANVS